MNICMLTSFFLPTIGGVENHVYHLSKELQEAGHNVTVVHTCFDIESNGAKTKIEYIDNIEVHRIYIGIMKFKLSIPFLSNINNYINGFLRKIRPIMYSGKIAKYVLKLNETKKFDIIHQHDFISNIFTTKRLSKYKPIVLTNHTGEYLLLEKYKITRLIIPNLVNHLSYLIGPSKDLADVKCMKKNASYITNGCDINAFYPLVGKDIEEKKIELNIPCNKKIVLCARRWAPTKGVIYLVKAINGIIANHPDTLFLLSGNNYYGYPDYVKSVMDIIESNDIANNIILLGDIPYNKMAAYDQIADIVVLPSVLEATSLSGLEAMSCGKALIGTDVGGIPEIIDDGKTGILVPKCDSDELAKAIDYLLENDDVRERMGFEARKKIELRFSWHVIARETEKIYDKILQSKSFIN